MQTTKYNTQFKIFLNFSLSFYHDNIQTMKILRPCFTLKYTLCWKVHETSKCTQGELKRMDDKLFLYGELTMCVIDFLKPFHSTTSHNLG